MFVSTSHVSHSAGLKDGGISFAIEGLLSAQSSYLISPFWHQASDHVAFFRDFSLLSDILRKSPDIVHLHGLWRSPTRIASLLSLSGFPIVISPHGMLDSSALKISRFKKSIVWRLWEKNSLSSSSCVHALCSSEADSIRQLLPNVPIAVIPNGITLPTLESSTLPPPWANDIPEYDRVLLFLGRFHRKKGISSLLEAWDLVSAAATSFGWWLVFVGYGDCGALSKHVEQSQSRGMLSRVRVYGPVTGDMKSSTFKSSSAFVLPSLSEGLPMAALEAMSYRLPCLLTNACNLPNAFDVGAALQIESDYVSLASSLESLFCMSASRLSELGISGRILVASQYSWPSVAKQTQELYSWMLGKCDLPSFVRHHR